MPTLTLKLLPETYAISQLPAAQAMPLWADGHGLVSVSRTPEELSVVCPEQRVPQGVRSEGGWICFALQGPFAFNETGILASIANPLAQAKVGIFALSTYNTDYVLVKHKQLKLAVETLMQVGHQVLTQETEQP